MVDFKENSLFMYWLMMASEDLLRLAAEHSKDEVLRNYFLLHIEEERDHVKSQRWDLEKMGVDLTFDFRAAAIAGSQYYLIFHRHPALFLGYMRVLESWPNDIEALTLLEKKYGPLKTLRYHVENDPSHAVDIKTMIEAQSAELQEDIETNSLWIESWINLVSQTMGQEDL